MGARLLVIKHEESGVHRLGDMLREGETVAYNPPTPKAAHMYLHQVNRGVQAVKVGQPAVSRRGKLISTPIDRE